MAKRYSNLYFVTREYGGPEEGGWYYNQDRIKRSEPYTEAGHAAMEAEVTGLNEGRRELSSVLSTGRYRLAAECEPGEDYPKKRPHYE